MSNVQYLVDHRLWRISVGADSAVLDGEICCLDPDGGTNFANLLFRREWPFFLAFDVLD